MLKFSFEYSLAKRTSIDVDRQTRNAANWGEDGQKAGQERTGDMKTSQGSSGRSVDDQVEQKNQKSFQQHLTQNGQNSGTQYSAKICV